MVLEETFGNKSTTFAESQLVEKAQQNSRLWEKPALSKIVQCRSVELCESLAVFHSAFQLPARVCPTTHNDEELSTDRLFAHTVRCRSCSASVLHTPCRTAANSASKQETMVNPFLRSFVQGVLATCGSTAIACGLAIQVEKSAHRMLFRLAPHKYATVEQAYGLT